MPTRRQRRARVRVSRFLVDPMPGLRGVRQRERRAVQAPALEVRFDDLDVPQRLGGSSGVHRHLGAWLDPEHRYAARREQPGRLAGAGADLQRPGARLGPRDEIVDQRRRVTRSCTVIEAGDLAEHQAPRPVGGDRLAHTALVNQSGQYPHRLLMPDAVHSGARGGWGAVAVSAPACVALATFEPSARCAR